mgnify:CR=1 FL=1
MGIVMETMEDRTEGTTARETELFKVAEIIDDLKLDIQDNKMSNLTTNYTTSNLTNKISSQE